MDNEPEYMACLLLHGKPSWIRHSLVRNVPITDAAYCAEVGRWWYDTLETETPNFEEWWLGYKKFLWSNGFMRGFSNDQ